MILLFFIRKIFDKLKRSFSIKEIKIPILVEAIHFQFKNELNNSLFDMSDKLNLSLEELIKKDKEGKRQSGGQKGGKFRKNRNNKPGFNRQQRMRQRLSTGNAPNARDKARQLRQNKVRNFGGNRNNQPQPFRSNRPRVDNQGEDRADRENWKKNEDREEKKRVQFQPNSK